MVDIKKLLKFSILATLTISILLYVGVFYAYRNLSTENILKKTAYRNQECFDTNFETINDIRNILVIGTDNRGGNEPTRADAIMILSIDSEREKMKLTSIMRDTYVKIRNHGYDKINHSYAFGGIELLKNTIEDNYGLVIHNYATIDFGGFKSVVDSIGGLEIDIHENEIKELNRCINLEIDEDEHLSRTKKKVLKEEAHFITDPGKQRLNGYQALAYSRIRKTGNGCYGRSERQRYVIKTLMNKMKDISFLRYPFIAKDFMAYVEADFKLNEILNTAYTVTKIPIDNMEQLQIPTNKLSYGTLYRNKGWVLLNDIQSNKKVINRFIYEDQRYVSSNYYQFNVKNSQYWPLRMGEKTRKEEEKSVNNDLKEEFEDINMEIERIFNNN